MANQGGLTFNLGGFGGEGPLSGGVLNWYYGHRGAFPWRRQSSGAGTGATGTTAYAAAAGLCIVRWSNYGALRGVPVSREPIIWLPSKLPTAIKGYRYEIDRSTRSMRRC